ncbi:glycosyltransferase family 2 protein [Roseicyclus persicicus]|uniref:Glycosyltransferase family 2 protein n=1 Tax=Roseicyclus persicicus TaxID=2650661 RepID=A0A7X6GXA5_9RHOB|nr:glycosyltransferase family 2 protein [Roseibacterium persicicum]NKX44094.1 glycosyltransferase family 2 protein [Roseibacterium persicicum]
MEQTTRLARDADAGTAVRPGRRVLFTAVRNEAPFLLEWIAYHQVIGFDTIIVASNDSDDGTDEVLQALEAAGQVQHIRHSVPVGQRPQANAARLVNDMGLLAEGDWALWLDADEFLNVQVGEGRLDDLIAALGPHDGALIAWRIFGDGGNARFPGRFISDAFTGASPPMFEKNLAVKTLFRFGRGVRGFGVEGNHRPVLAGGPDSAGLRFLAPNGQPIRTKNGVHAKWMAGKDTGGNWGVPRAELGHALAQINHYMVRTPDVYELKKARGRGWAAKVADNSNSRHTDDFYAINNRNDAEDRSILRFESEVSARMQHLLKDDATRLAQEAAQERAARSLAPADEPVPVTDRSEGRGDTRPTPFEPLHGDDFIFFIGFNKCGTTSLHGLLIGSGIAAHHWQARGRKNLAQVMQMNRALGRRPFFGFEKVVGFSDMTYADRGMFLEGCLHFDELHRAYPDAYFVLNTRPEDRWIRSRLNHGDGSLLARTMAATGLSREEIVESWTQLFRAHHARVESHFKGHPRYLRFDIENDPVSSLAGFLAPRFELDISKWQKLNSTRATVDPREAED